MLRPKPRLRHNPRCHIYRTSCGWLAATLLLGAGGFGSFGFGASSFGTMGSAIASEAVLVSQEKQAAENDAETIFTFPQNFEPPGDDRPEDTRGSGSRTGACSTGAFGVDAAIAETDRNETADRETAGGRIRAIAPPDKFGLTLQSHPTVFINFDGDVADAVVMRVQDEAGEYDERVTLPVDPERQVQGFALPGELPALAAGKNYKWTILVACDGQVNPYHPIFSGWVQRVAADEETVSLLQTLPQQPTESQVEWYTSGGYWYDAVATLDAALQTMPTDETVQLLWAQLLEFADSH